jgi:hypothetical protein
MASAATPHTSVLEVSVSNLGWDTWYSDWVYRGFPQSVKANDGT